MAGTYTDFNAHVIFATKHRLPIIDPSWAPQLYAYLGGTLKGLEAIPLSINGIDDHVHLLIGFRSKHCFADLMMETKKASSKWAKSHCPNFQWQDGYGAFTLSYRDLDNVRRYIARQQEHHRKVSAKDELLALCVDHGVQPDPRFFE